MSCNVIMLNMRNLNNFEQAGKADEIGIWFAVNVSEISFEEDLRSSWNAFAEPPPPIVVREPEPEEAGEGPALQVAETESTALLPVQEQTEVAVASGLDGGDGGTEKAAGKSVSFPCAGAAADAAGTGKEEEADGAKAEEGRQEGQGQEAKGLGGRRGRMG